MRHPAPGIGVQLLVGLDGDDHEPVPAEGPFTDLDKELRPRVVGHVLSDGERVERGAEERLLATGLVCDAEHHGAAVRVGQAQRRFRGDAQRILLRPRILLEVETHRLHAPGGRPIPHTLQSPVDDIGHAHGFSHV